MKYPPGKYEKMHKVISGRGLSRFMIGQLVQIVDSNCRMRTSGVIISNTEIIVNYYNLLEVNDKDCSCASLEWAD